MPPAIITIPIFFIRLQASGVKSKFVKQPSPEPKIVKNVPNPAAKSPHAVSQDAFVPLPDDAIR
jgi:hypothetical protein